MVGADSAPGDAVVTRLHRNLMALKTISSYQGSFLANNAAKTIQWGIVVQYMATVVDDGADHRCWTPPRRISTKGTVLSKMAAATQLETDVYGQRVLRDQLDYHTDR